VTVGQFPLFEGSKERCLKRNQTLNYMGAQLYGAYSFITEGMLEDIKSQVPIDELSTQGK
jgi:hypothetical protein